VTGQWLDVPEPSLLMAKASPFFAQAAHGQELVTFFSQQGAHIAHVDISRVQNGADVTSELRSVLPFPDWCGSGWDSMEDSFEELREAWQFPLVLVVSGIPILLQSQPQVAFQTAVRLSEFSRAFGLAGEDFLVLYLW